MKIRKLRELLAELNPVHDDKELVIWLPGSRVDTAGFMMMEEGAYVIEGNLRPGSALEVDAG